MFGRAWPQRNQLARPVRRVIGTPRCVTLCCGIFALVLGCKKPTEGGPSQGTATIPTVERIPPELAARVLAKVGDRVITVADYATTLDRMDRFERLRYQTPERRKALLDELVNTELLAREAERRGIDKRPETEAYLNQLMADEVRRRLRATLPQPEELNAEEVRAYYAARREQLREPERRRVAVLTFPSRVAAESALKELAKDASVTRWNELGRVGAAQTQATSMMATPVRGDVGFVTAGGGPSSGEPTVPDAARAAAFQLPIAGGVAPQVIEDRGLFLLVRVTTVAPSHLPTVEEADAAVRARLLDERLAEKERELSKLLASTSPVEVNEAVISRLKRATP